MFNKIKYAIKVRQEIKAIKSNIKAMKKNRDNQDPHSAAWKFMDEAVNQAERQLKESINRVKANYKAYGFNNI